MCGIAGYVSLENVKGREAILREMANALRHRGPDDEGYFFEPGIGLAARRLSIIDLPGSHQPVVNEDESIHLIFNGEIYNYLELRSILEKRGHRFSTQGDAETIVHLYEDHGMDLLRFLRGMFAFALWDSRKKLLFLARDRLGKKPLHYVEANGALFFCSELAPLLDQKICSWEIDPSALAAYLILGFVPSPLTIVRQVRKLPPAHYLAWQNGKIEIEKYWSVDFSRKIQCAYDDAREQVQAKLDESIRLRLRSDVPVGLLLSGGLDSNALLSRLVCGLGQKVQTFTVGFREKEYDESNAARLSARHFGVEHHELIGNTDLLKLLPDVVTHYGEPFADKSALPTMLVCELTRRQVKVALSGDGGDEDFAGYSKYLLSRWQQYSSQLLPGPMKEAWTIGSMTGENLHRFKLFRNIRRQFLPETHSLFSSEFFSGNQYERIATWLLQRHGADYLDSLAHQFWQKNLLPVDRMLDWDYRQPLPDSMLVKLDIASMSRSLEVRSPFLDQELVELCASFPASWKIHNGRQKLILRDIVGSDLPPEILHAPKKGFSVPLADWWRNEARAQIRDGLFPLHSELRPFIQEKACQDLLGEHQSGKANHALRLWALWILNEWARRFLNG
ncbi:MAG TPA: asparagine synthase (glutamine-hydrolyzing) [Chthoniobacterales bacterium]|nr:asparagine synthase (glutamine-hydrolyzing) [Chthoniobacterales bacterium]